MIPSDFLSANPFNAALAVGKLLTLIPANVGGLTIDVVPQSTTFVLGGLLLVVMMLVTKMLED